MLFKSNIHLALAKADVDMEERVGLAGLLLLMGELKNKSLILLLHLSAVRSFSPGAIQ
jgi:hypothetical protein